MVVTHHAEQLGSLMLRGISIDKVQNSCSKSSCSPIGMCFFKLFNNIETYGINM